MEDAKSSILQMAKGAIQDLIDSGDVVVIR